MGIITIPTSSESLQFPVDRLEEKILSFFEDQEAFALVWKVHEVIAGKIVQNQCLFYQSTLQPEFVQEARIFNETSELYLLRQEDIFVARFRKDGEGEKTDVYDERHFVNGHVQNWHNGWLKIAEENRGFLLFLPASVPVTGKVCYTARNYYCCDDDGQLCFKDARLCGFCKPDGTQLHPGGVL